MQAFQFGPFALEFPKIFLSTILGFVLIALLLYKLALPAVKGMLDERARRIETAQSQVTLALQEVKSVHDDYARRLNEIEAESNRQLQQAVREAEEARAAIIAEAKEAAALLRRRSDEELARERTRQRLQLKQQVVQIVLDTAEQAVRSDTRETVQRQLIDDFIRQAARTGAESNGSQFSRGA